MGEIISENRTEYRQYDFIRIKCTFPNDKSMELQTRNISRTGVFLSAMDNYHNLKAGDQIKMELYQNNVIKNALGEVVRVEKHGIAVKFIEKRVNDRLIKDKTIKCSLTEIPAAILHTRDISETGVFVEINRINHKEVIGNVVKLSIYDSGDITSVNAEIVRIEEIGIALKFVK